MLSKWMQNCAFFKYLGTNLRFGNHGGQGLVQKREMYVRWADSQSPPPPPMKTSAKFETKIVMWYASYSKASGIQGVFIAMVSYHLYR